MSSVIHNTPVNRDPDAAVGNDQLARQQAIKQIERRRHFRINAAASGVGMIILAVIWALSEYHNAGG